MEKNIEVDEDVTGNLNPADQIHHLSVAEIDKIVKKCFTEEEWERMPLNEKFRNRIRYTVYVSDPYYAEEYTLREYLTEKPPEPEKLFPHVTGTPLRTATPEPYDGGFWRSYTTCDSSNSSNELTPELDIPHKRTLEELWDASDEEHEKERAARRLLDEKKKRARGKNIGKKQVPAKRGRKRKAPEKPKAPTKPRGRKPGPVKLSTPRLKTAPVTRSAAAQQTETSKEPPEEPTKTPTEEPIKPPAEESAESSAKPPANKGVKPAVQKPSKPRKPRRRFCPPPPPPCFYAPQLDKPTPPVTNTLFLNVTANRICSDKFLRSREKRVNVPCTRSNRYCPTTIPQSYVAPNVQQPSVDLIRPPPLGTPPPPLAPLSCRRSIGVNTSPSASMFGSGGVPTGPKPLMSVKPLVSAKLPSRSIPATGTKPLTNVLLSTNAKPSTSIESSPSVESSTSAKPSISTRDLSNEPSTSAEPSKNSEAATSMEISESDDLSTISGPLVNTVPTVGSLLPLPCHPRSSHNSRFKKESSSRGMEWTNPSTSSSSLLLSKTHTQVSTKQSLTSTNPYDQQIQRNLRDSRRLSTKAKLRASRPYPITYMRQPLSNYYSVVSTVQANTPTTYSLTSPASFKGTTPHETSSSTFLTPETPVRVSDAVSNTHASTKEAKVLSTINPTIYSTPEREKRIQPRRKINRKKFIINLKPRPLQDITKPFENKQNILITKEKLAEESLPSKTVANKLVSNENRTEISQPPESKQLNMETRDKNSAEIKLRDIESSDMDPSKKVTTLLKKTVIKKFPPKSPSEIRMPPHVKPCPTHCPSLFTETKPVVTRNIIKPAVGSCFEAQRLKIQAETLPSITSRPSQIRTYQGPGSKAQKAAQSCSDSKSELSEVKPDETTVDQITVVQETASQLSVIQAPVVQASVFQVTDPKVSILQEPIDQTSDTERPSIKVSADEPPVIQAPVVEVLVTESSVLKDQIPAIQTPVVQTSVNFSSEIQVPVIKEPIVESVIKSTTIQKSLIQSPILRPAVLQLPVKQPLVIQTPIVEVSDTKYPVINEPVNQIPVIQTPVVHEPLIQTSVDQAPLTQQPVIKPSSDIQVSVIKKSIVESVIKPTASQKSRIHSPILKPAVLQLPAKELPAILAPAVELPDSISTFKKESFIQTLVVQEPLIQTSVDQAPLTQQLVIKSSSETQVPVIKELIVEPVIKPTTIQISRIQSPIIKPAVLQLPVKQPPVIQAPVDELPDNISPVKKESFIQTPVVQEPLIQTSIDQTTLTQQPVIKPSSEIQVSVIKKSIVESVIKPTASSKSRIQSPVLKPAVLQLPAEELPVILAPVVELPDSISTVKKESFIQTPVVQEPLIQTSVDQAPLTQQLVIKSSSETQVPVIKELIVEPVIKPTAIQISRIQSPIIKPAVLQLPVKQPPVIQAPVDEVPVTESLVIKESVDQTVAKSPVIKESVDQILAIQTSVIQETLIQASDTQKPEIKASSEFQVPEIKDSIVELEDAPTVIQKSQIQLPILKPAVLQLPVIQPSVIQVPVVKVPVPESPVIKEPINQISAIQTPVVQEPLIQTSVDQAPLTQQQVIKPSLGIQVPVIKEPIVEPVVKLSDIQKPNSEVVIQPATIEAQVINSPIFQASAQKLTEKQKPKKKVKQSKFQSPAIIAPALQPTIIKKSRIQSPIFKSNVLKMIQQSVIQSTSGIKTTATQTEEIQGPVNNEPVFQPIAIKPPIIKPTASQSLVVQVPTVKPSVFQRPYFQGPPPKEPEFHPIAIKPPMIRTASHTPSINSVESGIQTPDVNRTVLKRRILKPLYRRVPARRRATVEPLARADKNNIQPGTSSTLADDAQEVITIHYPSNVDQEQIQALASAQPINIDEIFEVDIADNTKEPKQQFRFPRTQDSNITDMSQTEIKTTPARVVQSSSPSQVSKAPRLESMNQDEESVKGTPGPPQTFKRPSRLTHIKRVIATTQSGTRPPSVIYVTGKRDSRGVTRITAIPSQALGEPPGLVPIGSPRVQSSFASSHFPRTTQRSLIQYRPRQTSLESWRFPSPIRSSMEQYCPYSSLIPTIPGTFMQSGPIRISLIRPGVYQVVHITPTSISTPRLYTADEMLAVEVLAYDLRRNVRRTGQIGTTTATVTRVTFSYTTTSITTLDPATTAIDTASTSRLATRTTTEVEETPKFDDEMDPRRPHFRPGHNGASNKRSEFHGELPETDKQITNS